MTTHSYDCIVIGAGGGLKLALAAAARGRKTALIESRELGGTCLNRGCIPSKMLIYPADLMRIIERCASLNLHVNPAAVRFQALMDRINATLASMGASLENTVHETPGLDLFRTPALFISNNTVVAGGQPMRAPRIIIATGSRPAIPDLPGLDQIPFLTSESALRQDHVPKRLIVLGAGYIACELGHAYATYGAETHFVVRSHCLRREDVEIREKFLKELARHHHLHIGCQVESTAPLSRGRGVCVKLKKAATGKSFELQADALLVAAGVRPETDRLGLANTDITRQPNGSIVVDNWLQTAVPGIYAMGDCIGRHMFRHAVNFEADFLAHHLFDNNPEPICYPPMPGAVFTDPEIASVGLTEKEAKKRNLDVCIGRASLASSNMGLARQLPDGLVKLLVARGNRRLIGAHIVGEDAATLLHVPLTVMTLKGTIDDLASLIYIHPAYPEVIRDAARDALSAWQAD